MSVLLKAIRQKCIDCSGGSISEVRKCPCVACPLFPFRMGKNSRQNPRKATEQQLEALYLANSARAEKARTKSAASQDAPSSFHEET